jgi:Tol biopolymer transport system component
MTLKIAATTLRGVLFAGVFTFTAAVARGDSEIVIAIRYLQAKGTSHSHLYLYREDGKRLRQLTSDNSGQDVDPIFSPNGETIVFAREKPNDAREFWSIDPRGTQLKKLDATPDWYAAVKSSPVRGTPPRNHQGA